MKRRASISGSEYSKKRSESYKKMCDEILFNHKMKIEIDDLNVFLLFEDKKKHLLTITNPKSTSFEIWLKLKEDLSAIIEDNK